MKYVFPDDTVWGGGTTCGHGTNEWRQNKKKQKKRTYKVAYTDMHSGRCRWRVGARHGGMSRCQVWVMLRKQEWAERDNRKKKNYSLIMKTIPGQCQRCWHSTEAWHRQSWKRLGEWGWCGMWQVRGSPQKWECKQRETTKKKKLMWLGHGQWGPKARTTQQSTWKRS